MTFWQSDPRLTFRTCAWKIWRVFERNMHSFEFLVYPKNAPFWKLAWKNAVMDYMPGDSLWLNHLKESWTFTIPKRSGSQNCQVIVTLHLATKNGFIMGQFCKVFGAFDSSVPLRISSCSDILNFFAKDYTVPKTHPSKKTVSFWCCLRSHPCFIFTQQAWVTEFSNDFVIG